MTKGVFNFRELAPQLGGFDHVLNKATSRIGKSLNLDQEITENIAMVALGVLSLVAARHIGLRSTVGVAALTGVVTFIPLDHLMKNFAGRKVHPDEIQVGDTLLVKSSSDTVIQCTVCSTKGETITLNHLNTTYTINKNDTASFVLLPSWTRLVSALDFHAPPLVDNLEQLEALVMLTALVAVGALFKRQFVSQTVVALTVGHLLRAHLSQRIHSFRHPLHVKLKNLPYELPTAEPVLSKTHLLAPLLGRRSLAPLVGFLLQQGDKPLPPARQLLSIDFPYLHSMLDLAAKETQELNNELARVNAQKELRDTILRLRTALAAELDPDPLPTLVGLSLQQADLLICCLMHQPQDATQRILFAAKVASKGLLANIHWNANWDAQNTAEVKGLLTRVHSPAHQMLPAIDRGQEVITTELKEALSAIDFNTPPEPKDLLSSNTEDYEIWTRFANIDRRILENASSVVSDREWATDMVSFQQRIRAHLENSPTNKVVKSYRHADALTSHMLAYQAAQTLAAKQNVAHALRTSGLLRGMPWNEAVLDANQDNGTPVIADAEYRKDLKALMQVAHPFAYQIKECRETAEGDDLLTGEIREAIVAATAEAAPQDLLMGEHGAAWVHFSLIPEDFLAGAMNHLQGCPSYETLNERYNALQTLFTPAPINHIDALSPLQHRLLHRYVMVWQATDAEDEAIAEALRGDVALADVDWNEAWRGALTQTPEGYLNTLQAMLTQARAVVVE